MILTETWLKNSDYINIKGNICINNYLRENIKSGGVAIYKNSNNNNNTYTTTENIINSKSMSGIADICITKINLQNNYYILIIGIYISPNTNIKYIKNFIYEKLKNIDKGMPLLLCGDFNINLQKKENHEFIDFMKANFGLNLISKIEESTTIKKSCIDLFFTRYLTINLKYCISYFTYHKPIFGLIKFDE